MGQQRRSHLIHRHGIHRCLGLARALAWLLLAAFSGTSLVPHVHQSVHKAGVYLLATVVKQMNLAQAKITFGESGNPRAGT